MNGMPAKTRMEVENLVLILLRDALKKHGLNPPVNDPDFAEAHGVMRGAALMLGCNRPLGKLRLEPGRGKPTHTRQEWWRLLVELAESEHMTSADA